MSVKWCVFKYGEEDSVGVYHDNRFIKIISKEVFLTVYDYPDGCVIPNEGDLKIIQAIHEEASNSKFEYDMIRVNENGNVDVVINHTNQIYEVTMYFDCGECAFGLTFE
ncbi:MAG: hypothetical protein ABIK96_00785 [bacterium]